MNRDTLHEMIDACRPGSEDVHAPSMQPLADAIAHDEGLGRAYQATQRADATIGQAFRAVSPPEGLANRLLESVQAAAEEEVQEKPQPVSPKRRGRRRFLVWGPMIGLALAASVSAMVVYYPFTPAFDVSDDHGRNAMVTEQWVPEAAAEGGWQDPSTMPHGFPGPHQVSAKLARWKMVDDGRTVCYQLVADKTQLALLFVTKQPTTDLPSAPTLPGATAYQGAFLTTAWSAHDHVYVLAVRVAEGSARDLFRQIISVPTA